jgi:diguanylate cyclase (GGDEF)-like protein
MVLLGRLTVSLRFLLVLAIGLLFQAAISGASLLKLKQTLLQDRADEVKHLDQAAYSVVAFFHDQAAQGLISDAAARHAAANVVRAMHYDTSNYFFIWDLDGTGIAHGAQPALEGKTFIGGPDAANNPVVAKMVRQLISVAKSQPREGVSNYLIPKKGQTRPQAKLTYSKLFAPWGWSIGTGAYVDDIQASFAAHAISALSIFLCLMTVACAASFIIARDMLRAMKRLTDRVTDVARGDLEGDVPDIGRTDEIGAIARALLILRDNSRDAAELRLDYVTRLPTRKLLMDRLRQAQRHAARAGQWAALMFIDIDRFKALNDTYGHDSGDAMLREIARRLDANLRAGDTIARLGGDEFVLVLLDLGPAEQDAATAMDGITAQILALLNQTYYLPNVVHTSTASIGITLFGAADASADDLLKQADLAMYTAKNAGRNTGRLFHPQMAAMERERAVMEQELRQAILDREFEVFYQPQIALDGDMMGAEALVRWRHPTRGLLLPGAFIPLAEDTGLIVQLGEIVLDIACRQLAAWASRPQTARLMLGVNVSAREFQRPDFIARTLSTLRRAGADPRRLTLELTESMIAHDLDEVVEKMSCLKAEGVSFSLDDFGTGYSSLDRLKRLPLDQLKIDRSFVRDILVDQDDAAITNMILALAKTLHLEVVAEGIETAGQWALLRRAGCDYGQGYVFSRPLPLDEFEHFARQWNEVPSAPRAPRQLTARVA